MSVWTWLVGTQKGINFVKSIVDSIYKIVEQLEQAIKELDDEAKVIDTEIGKLQEKGSEVVEYKDKAEKLVRRIGRLVD